MDELLLDVGHAVNAGVRPEEATDQRVATTDAIHAYQISMVDTEFRSAVDVDKALGFTI